MGKLTDRVAKGVFWVLMEKFGLQAVHFVVTLVLARLLTPNDYGTVALLSIFIHISNVFVDCGFGKALVQKKKATQTDMNSVFFLSVAIALVLYAVLFVAAPWVADFYRIPELTVMMRVLAVSLIFHSINGVQNVELNRKMLFHLSFRISWARVAVSSITGISFAYAGYGPWALVWSSLFGGVTGVIARQIVIHWRPTMAVSLQSIRELFGYGWKVTAIAVINQIYSNIQGLLIGRFYTRADLAFVNKGRHIPNLLKNIVDGSLTRVSFSALSKLQDDPDKLCNAMRRMIRTTTFCIYPMMAVLVILADPLITVLYGAKWRPAVPFLQIICFSAALTPFDTVNRQALLARGRSDIVLRLMVLRRICCLIVLALTIRLGVLTFFACSTFTIVPLGVIINSLPNRKHLGYKIMMQLRDVSESFLLALAMAALLYATTFIPLPKAWMLLPQIVLAFAFYVTCAVMFRNGGLVEILKALLPTLSAKLGEKGWLIVRVRRFAEGKGNPRV